MNELTRRRFLQSGAAAAVCAASGLGYALSRDPIRVGVIGLGGRGRQLAQVLRWTCVRRRYAQVAALCDVNRRRLEAIRDEAFPQADLYGDYRRLLEREDLEAVFIATPDHWHAQMARAALEAGKAVYCEKPLTLTIAEGQMLASVVEQTGGVLQVGSQQRSCRYFQAACELVRNGRLGVLHHVKVTLPSNSLPADAYAGPFENRPAPDYLDWDAWQGTASRTEFCPQRYDPFRWWFEYSGGFMTDWGAHHLDIAQWAMGVDRSGPVAIEGRAELPRIPNGFNTPRDFEVDLTYANGVTVRIELSESTSGVLFQGDQGEVFCNRRRVSGKPVEELERRPLKPGDVCLRNHVRTIGSASDILSLRADRRLAHLGRGQPASDRHGLPPGEPFDAAGSQADLGPRLRVRAERPGSAGHAEPPTGVAATNCGGTPADPPGPASAALGAFGGGAG